MLNRQHKSTHHKTNNPHIDISVADDPSARSAAAYATLPSTCLPGHRLLSTEECAVVFFFSIFGPGWYK